MVLQAINEAFSKYPICVFGHSKNLFKCRAAVGPVSSALKFWSEIPRIPHALNQARQHLGHTAEGKGNRSSRKFSEHCEMLPEIFMPCHCISPEICLNSSDAKN